MAHLNGAATYAPRMIPAPAGSGGRSSRKFTTERLEHIRERLAEPFDPGEIKWRVTATSTKQTKHGLVKRGQLAAYADPRAYTDRLNEVFGEWGWTRDYDVQVVQNFERRLPADRNKSAVCAKMVVVSKVTILGLGSHTGVGEEWADDENAATRAEAQAFKRACSCFGLGRYLYNFDTVWVDLDEYGRPVHAPNLPDWALPGYAKRETQRLAANSRTAQAKQNIVQQETVAKVRELRETVGLSLSRFVLKKYGGAIEPGKVGFAKLTIVYEKLTDIARGIDRLRKGAEVIGQQRYSAICREMNLASASIDDIPDRNKLKSLLERVEAEVAGSAPAAG
jgi:hypothetical protein